MATTSIIVEILIVGFFVCIWIFLFCLRASLVDLESVKDLSSKIDPTAAVLVVAIVSYQLGIIMNTFSYHLTKRFTKQKYREEIAPGTDYHMVWATVKQKGSEEMVRTLSLYLSFVRLTRAGIISFPLIAIGMFSFGGRIALAGFIPLLVSIGCFIAWREAYRVYYQRMGFAYQVIAKIPMDDSPK
jgi:hypothetical protein